MSSPASLTCRTKQVSSWKDMATRRTSRSAIRTQCHSNSATVKAHGASISCRLLISAEVNPMGPLEDQLQQLKKRYVDSTWEDKGQLGVFVTIPNLSLPPGWSKPVTQVKFLVPQ